MLSSAEVCPFLTTAGCVKTYSCMGFIPAAIRKGGGREECSESHSLRKLPCGRFVGGEEAAWGLLTCICTRRTAGFASRRVGLLARAAAGGGVLLEFKRE